MGCGCPALEECPVVSGPRAEVSDSTRGWAAGRDTSCHSIFFCAARKVGRGFRVGGAGVPGREAAGSGCPCG